MSECAIGGPLTKSWLDSGDDVMKLVISKCAYVFQYGGDGPTKEDEEPFKAPEALRIT